MPENTLHDSAGFIAVLCVSATGVASFVLSYQLFRTNGDKGLTLRIGLKKNIWLHRCRSQNIPRKCLSDEQNDKIWQVQQYWTHFLLVWGVSLLTELIKPAC